MICAEIFQNDSLVYRTSSVRQFEFRLLTLNRLSEDGSIASRGPHFHLGLANVGGGALKGDRPEFRACGKRTLGSVDFVAGAQARDGTESWDVATIAASWEGDANGLRIAIDLTLGDPLLKTFCYRPKSRLVEAFQIAIDIPIKDLARFWMVRKPEAMNNLKTSIEANFGAEVAESIEPYV